jgi:hypothetical protein
MGARASVLGVDDRPLLVDRRVVRTVAVRLHIAPGARYACQAAADGATRRRRVFRRDSTSISFERPVADGIFGTMFDLLMGFDRPFNQIPSLHIALAVILWALYARKVTGLARILLDVWFMLIGASVLTTYQHHFIDIPTGFAARLALRLAVAVRRRRRARAGFRMALDD